MAIVTVVKSEQSLHLFNVAPDFKIQVGQEKKFAGRVYRLADKKQLRLAGVLNLHSYPMNGKGEIMVPSHWFREV